MTNFVSVYFESPIVRVTQELPPRMGLLKSSTHTTYNYFGKTTNISQSLKIVFKLKTIVGTTVCFLLVNNGTFQNHR